MNKEQLQTRIEQFRKEFSISKKDVDDEEIEEAIFFLEENADRISQGNYKLKDGGYIVQFKKIDGHFGYEKYISAGDTRWVFFYPE